VTSWPVATLLTRPKADRGQAAIASYIQGRFDEQRRPGRRERVSDSCGGMRLVHRMSRPNGGIMSSVPTNVGVFFGQVDKQAEGWYWADAQSEKLKRATRGPFETKELAVKDAL
jgi:hypothetical protein